MFRSWRVRFMLEKEFWIEYRVGFLWGLGVRCGFRVFYY